MVVVRVKPISAGASDSGLISPGAATAAPITAYVTADGIEASVVPSRYRLRHTLVVPYAYPISPNGASGRNRTSSTADSPRRFSQPSSRCIRPPALAPSAPRPAQRPA